MSSPTGSCLRKVVPSSEVPKHNSRSLIPKLGNVSVVGLLVVWVVFWQM
jgi:hypothetical protein